MDHSTLEFLKTMVNTPGPSGYEQAVQAVYRRYVQTYADTVTTDVLGNVTAAINPEHPLRVMLAGHADEIGFQIRYIADDGSLYFGQIGGHDAVVAVGQRVNIHTANGPISGVLGRKAIHLLEAGERDKVPRTDDLWIDIGAINGDEAKKVVAIGDCVTYAPEFQMLQGTRATARSFDNKMGCVVIAEALRLLKERSVQCGVFAVANVQEEIGLRGARAAAYAIAPTVGIATDVCHAMDFPGADKKKVGDIKLGAGPVIGRGANINPRVFELLVAAAIKLDIPYQIEALPAGTGTDANAMQVSQGGMATGLISVPLRYMHTPCEVMDLDDISNAALLMAEFVAGISQETNWIP